MPGIGVFDPRPDPPTPVAPLVADAGAGSPEGVYYGWPGVSYWDVTANAAYYKDTGNFTKTGWVLAAGGGGGSGSGYVLRSAGDPSGPPGGDAANNGVHLNTLTGVKRHWDGTDWV